VAEEEEEEEEGDLKKINGNPKRELLQIRFHWEISCESKQKNNKEKIHIFKSILFILNYSLFISLKKINCNLNEFFHLHH